MLNLTVLIGSLSSRPEHRELPSGARLATLQVRVRDTDQSATSVPVALWNPPKSLERLDAGDDVTIVGRVNRRFFARADGARGSRVEVVAECVVPASQRRRTRAALDRAHRALHGLLDDGGIRAGAEA